jgi:hypothetical protein
LFSAWRSSPCLALIIVTLWATITQAESQRGRVLIVELPGAPTLTPRLRAELAALGLDSESMPLAAAPELGTLAELARAHRSEVALFVEFGVSGARVSIADRVTNKVLRRDLPTTDATGPNETVPSSDELASSVALGAVELLRASLLELDTLVPDGALETHTAWIEVARPPSVFALGLGLALRGGPGGAPPLVMLDLGGSLALAKQARVTLTGSLPVHPTHLEHAPGNATLWLGSMALGLRLEPKGERRLQPEFELGWLGACLSADGAAKPPYQGQRVRSISGGPHLALGLRYALSRSLALRAGLDIALFLSRFAISFGDHAVTHIGRPWLGLMFGVELRP